MGIGALSRWLAIGGCLRILKISLGGVSIACFEGTREIEGIIVATVISDLGNAQTALMIVVVKQIFGMGQAKVDQKLLRTHTDFFFEELFEIVGIVVIDLFKKVVEIKGGVAETFNDVCFETFNDEGMSLKRREGKHQVGQQFAKVDHDAVFVKNVRGIEMMNLLETLKKNTCCVVWDDEHILHRKGKLIDGKVDITKTRRRAIIMGHCWLDDDEIAFLIVLLSVLERNETACLDAIEEFKMLMGMHGGRIGIGMSADGKDGIHRH